MGYHYILGIGKGGFGTSLYHHRKRTVSIDESTAAEVYTIACEPPVKEHGIFRLGTRDHGPTPLIMTHRRA